MNGKLPDLFTVVRGSGILRSSDAGSCITLPLCGRRNAYYLA
jgi:hypothetical protein